MTYSEVAIGPPYKNPEVPIEDRVEDLVGRMTLAEKIGQMAQGERGSLSGTDHVTAFALGSVLSGGGSAPPRNTPEGWADLYDAFQAQALRTRLQIPILYGIDAVHGHKPRRFALRLCGLRRRKGESGDGHQRSRAFHGDA